jgi:hypothetical protein
MDHFAGGSPKYDTFFLQDARPQPHPRVGSKRLGQTGEYRRGFRRAAVPIPARGIDADADACK